MRKTELLRELALQGVSFDDPRLRYVEVQIDRDTWNELQREYGEKDS